ncbi:glycosyl transferase family protein [Marinomonas sp. 15G1-11]|uniref:Glycosyl transferase family protein n=1 Tax=Marinomonas phaeophyticola TaxID=3004091 RepID=A0ABT4JYB8_9GAMM|nr:glycosyl transferase family protein [Marinomonas sp. 15G1-11]MCZ2723411.1 glycosyl transferase family protein [Marinomonas sp. 15G1-11]
MSTNFVDYIKILGKGKKGSRSLTRQESRHAMMLILSGQVVAEQLGAFWMLIRIREETIEETVGFTQAIREHCRLSLSVKVDIDWPAYAGKRNELPWFLFSALALSQQGINIFMHGHAFLEEDRFYVESALQRLGFPIAHTKEEAEAHLKHYHFAYMSLDNMAPKLARLMDLKLLLGLRSPVNTLVRMMNLTQAEHSVHGVFHKGYDELHIQASAELGDDSVLVFRGGNGEAEINPERQVELGFVQGDHVEWESWPRSALGHCRQKNRLDIERMAYHWTGVQEDEFGGLAIIGTIACILRLITQKDATECNDMAKAFWQGREKWIFTTQRIA